ncbi:MAG: hypothetical protein J5614_03415, partial [Paludibacteraceae bacterium]|nr:hypothetical protein [Paludibacteraceae bacterium]
GIGYKENKFIPTAYYTFSHRVVKEVKRDSSVLRIDGTNTPDFKVWSVSFGMIPRRLSYRLPEILWSDSMDYYNPNIRGILLQCTKNNLVFHEISLDWRSLQSTDQREAFNVNYNVRKYFHRYLRGISPFFIGGNAQLNHLAKRNPAPEGEGVNDDMFVYPYIGWDFSDKTVFDRFRIKVGYAVSFDRCRAIGDWEVDGGLLADFTLQWKKIGVKETFYAGDRQFPLYPMYGSLLNMGDPHYQSSVYSKTSVYSPIVENRYVSFGASLDFHVTKEGTSCYQKVYLNVNLGNVDN